ncbi:hypothetical protein SDC9_202374 [bioreactor metagenome]|uniref:Uncharacterized protein n=1 Tax=bioreactor metagenome TaxID=1076179 RepID=A0A645IU69_9ZZZZ
MKLAKILLNLALQDKSNQVKTNAFQPLDGPQNFQNLESMLFMYLTYPFQKAPLLQNIQYIIKEDPQLLKSTKKWEEKHGFTLALSHLKRDVTLVNMLS